MPTFEIVLINEKEKTYPVIGWILIITNFISLVLITISSDFKKPFPFIGACVIFFLAILLRYLKSSKDKMIFWVPLLFYSILWDALDYWWVGIADILFAILGIAAARKLVVVFNADKIKYPSLFYKTVLWKELSNALLKDGFLTIDFKNNKIIQQRTDESSSSINETEFNDFCRQQLKLSTEHSKPI